MTLPTALRLEWPEVFCTGTIPPERSDLELCCDALDAWAACVVNKEIPVCFGDVMAAISKRLGVIGTPESFVEYARAKAANAAKGETE